MKDKLTCYIVDDEPLAQEILEEYIKKVPFLELIGTFSSPIESTGQMKKDKPDLLFLDINMPDLDGLSFISMLNPRPIIILTTAYDQYALKAYELEVSDYLVKPISFERFYKGVVRIFQNQGTKQLQKKEADPEINTDKESVFLKVGNRIQQISLKDILFIEGEKDYLRIHTRNEKFMTLMSFSKLLEELPSHKFPRVHKSFVVSIDKIDHIERNRIWIGDKIIPISKTYKESFLGLLNA